MLGNASIAAPSSIAPFQIIGKRAWPRASPRQWRPPRTIAIRVYWSTLSIATEGRHCRSDASSIASEIAGSLGGIIVPDSNGRQNTSIRLDPTYIAPHLSHTEFHTSLQPHII